VTASTFKVGLRDLAGNLVSGPTTIYWEAAV
jgi:hypothetical protein